MPSLRQRPRSREAAFSLVDVMMGAVILVVALMGTIQAVTIGSEMLATARRQTLASQIMDHELEKLRMASWTTISGLADGPTTVTIDSQFASAVVAAGANFSLSRSVAYVDPTSSSLAAAGTTTSLREVTFTVTWVVVPSGFTASRTYTRSKSAFFGKYGLNLSYRR